MMFARKLAPVALAVAVSACLFPSAAHADFALVSQDLTVNRQAQNVAFSLTFNQVPNFATVAADGTPGESFQVEFDGASASALPSDLTAVVRGDEIHLGGGLRVRSPSGDGGANSGGWGPVVGAVPFSLTGTTVAFDMSAKELGWTGGSWSANIYSLSAGALTAQQTATSIPTPPAFWGGLAGLGLLAAGSTWHAATRRRRAAAFGG